MATEARADASPRSALTLASLAVAVCVFIAACVHAPQPAATRDAVASYTAQVINPDLVGGLRVPHSNVVLVWGSDGSILRSAGDRGWDYASTPVATDLTRVASDDTGRALVAVGKAGVVLRSEDGGRTWLNVLNAGNDVDFTSVVHRAPSSTWFVAGTKGTLLRSADAGTTWIRSMLPITGTIETLFVDPSTQSLFFGAEGGIIGRSIDAGESWELTRIDMPTPATPIARFFRQDALLVATSALGRFLTSTDDGKTWTLVQSPTGAYFTDVAFDPRHQALVMTGHDATILRTLDRGRTWTVDVLTSGVSRNYLSAVRYDEASQSLLVVGHGGTLARSMDGGATWHRSDVQAFDNFEGLVMSDDALIAFGQGGSILTSMDAGEHWQPARNTLALYLRDITRTPDSTALIATGQLGEIIRSHDGVEWHRIAMDYPDRHTPPDLRALTASTSGDALIAAGPPGAILRSNSTGDRWELVRWNALDAGRAYPWILQDRTRNAVVTLDARGAMQVSRDNGKQWNEIDAQLEGEFWHGAVLERASIMIVAGKGGSVARSEDSGKRWSNTNVGTKLDLFGSYADEASERFFLMGQDGTLLSSTDRALTWRSLESGTRSPLRRMVRDPHSGALICFGGEGVILRSQDGESWQRVDSGVSSELRKAIVDPGDAAVVIAGRNGTVLQSFDGGARWQRLPTHTQRHFTSIAARANGDLVAVGERIVHLKRNEE